MDFLKQFKNQFSSFFKAVDPGTKVITFLFLLVLGISIFVAVFLNRKPRMTLLYANLSETQASGIVRILDDNSIPYDLKNNGRNVYIEKDKVSRTRLLLKEKNLPKDDSSIGYEIFDKTSLGVTEFVQNIQHLRALSGELERTIAKIQGVESVRVHIVLPEEKLFEKDKVEATSTVMLGLKFDGVLSHTQVNGIRQLVSASVEGLKPNNVTIVDNFGNVLAAPINDEQDVGMMTTRMGVQKNLEEYYLNKVQSLLDSVLGRSKSVVRVDALLDFDKIEETEEKFDPESAVVRSEVITSENASGASKAAKGPPGIQSNTQPGSNDVSGNSQENNSTREVINNKYEIDKKVRHIVKGVGDIKKLTVSVFIKQKVQMDEKDPTKPVLDENGNMKVIPRTQEELNAFNDIVQNAIGYNPDRGDRIVIKEVQFDKPHMDTAVQEALSKGGSDVNDFIAPVVKFGILVVLMVVLFSMVRKRVGGEGSGSSASYSSGGGSSRSSRSLDSDDDPALAEMREKSLQLIEKGGQVEGELSQVVDKFPSETEHVLKKWLGENLGEA